MKIKRYELTNAADGWYCNVLRVDVEKDGVWTRSWSSDGRKLEPSEDGRQLVLPGTTTLFILPEDDDE